MTISLVTRDDYIFTLPGTASALSFENAVHSGVALSREKLGSQSLLQRTMVYTSPWELEEPSSWLQGAFLWVSTGFTISPAA